MSIDPKRDALARWASVAAGHIDAETAAWLAEVAKGVIEAAGLKDANSRRLALTRACGVAGKSLSLDAYALRTLAAAPEFQSQKALREVLPALLPRGVTVSPEAQRKRASLAKKKAVLRAK